MFFSKQPVGNTQSNVFLRGEELELVEEFKYLCVILDSSLTFKNHIKKISNTIKFNLQNFIQIRASLTVTVARTFLHAMIFSHIEYCFTNWSLTDATTIKPIESLYKKALKVHILQKHIFLSFDNFKNFKYACSVYKTLNGLAPPPLSEYIKLKTNRGTTTRATTRGDCEVPFRHTTFGQTVLSVKGSIIWNSIPPVIWECPTYITFKTHF